MNRSPWGVVVLSLVLAAMAWASWQWESRLPRQVASRSPNAGESLRLALKQFPLPTPAAPADEVPATEWEGVVKANPFSAERWKTPEDILEGSGVPAAPPPPARPVFVYKGRILMGSAQRAILEESVSKKTHFLQVGQEVAGFKVLDISETQVVLLETSTQHEVVVFVAAKPQSAP
ncbi:MAG: hypothetical protein HYY15_03680 [Candidatus Omnitrophica bacterium]|nr:hypothetical protein [Candidatus Omnitrophota bacterium]